MCTVRPEAGRSSSTAGPAHIPPKQWSSAPRGVGLRAAPAAEEHEAALGSACAASARFDAAAERCAARACGRRRVCCGGLLLAPVLAGVITTALLLLYRCGVWATDTRARGRRGRARQPAASIARALAAVRGAPSACLWLCLAGVQPPSVRRWQPLAPLAPCLTRSGGFLPLPLFPSFPLSLAGWLAGRVERLSLASSSGVGD